MSAKERLDILKERLDDLFTENQRLKQLCDRYEEEHNNEFKKWQEATKRIDTAVEYIYNYINQFNGVYPIADMRYLDLHKLLDILKGVDKE